MVKIYLLLLPSAVEIKVDQLLVMEKNAEISPVE
jgi:hypothetical protein